MTFDAGASKSQEAAVKRKRLSIITWVLVLLVGAYFSPRAKSDVVRTGGGQTSGGGGG